MKGTHHLLPQLITVPFSPLLLSSFIGSRLLLNEGGDALLALILGTCYEDCLGLEFGGCSDMSVTDETGTPMVFQTYLRLASEILDEWAASQINGNAQSQSEVELTGNVIRECLLALAGSISIDGGISRQNRAAFKESLGTFVSKVRALGRVK